MSLKVKINKHKAAVTTKSSFSVQQALDLLESSSDDDDDDHRSNNCFKGFKSADIVIVPPGYGDLSDEDSGPEDEADILDKEAEAPDISLRTLNRINGRQLKARARLEYVDRNGDRQVIDEEDEELAVPILSTPEPRVSQVFFASDTASRPGTPASDMNVSPGPSRVSQVFFASDTANRPGTPASDMNISPGPSPYRYGTSPQKYDVSSALSEEEEEILPAAAKHRKSGSCRPVILSSDEEFVSPDASSGKAKWKRNKLASSSRKPQPCASSRVDQKSEDSCDSDTPLALLQPDLPCDPKNREWRSQDLFYKPGMRRFCDPSPPRIVDPVELFELFFDDELIGLIVDNSNKYASQTGKRLDVTDSEIRCFLAILILSGYLPQPRYRMMWEVGTESYLRAVAESMRRNRFEQIKSCLHVCDNTNLQSGNKFAKLQPYFDMLNERFMKFGLLEQNLCVDESMCPYFGLHSCKQFLRGKPIRFGYKFWCLCNRLGYIYRFFPYQGKDSHRKYGEMGLGASVVLQLADSLPKKRPFNIYGDRFFSGLQLCEALKQRGIGYTGTIMGNRLQDCPLPKAKEFKDAERGAMQYQLDTRTNIVVVAWNDNRVVHALSTIDPVLPLDTKERWIKKDKAKKPIPRPNMIRQYNYYMGGVDRMDQNIGNYRTGIRSKKWWWSPFVFGINTTVHNAWQLHRVAAAADGQNPLDLVRFIRKICLCYLQKYGTKPVGGGRPRSAKAAASNVDDNVRFDGIKHYLDAKEDGRRSRCAQCHEGSATMVCGKCRVALHQKCFRLFHGDEL